MECSALKTNQRSVEIIIINNIQGKGKDKVNHAPQESIGGAHFPLPDLEPVGGDGMV